MKKYISIQAEKPFAPDRALPLGSSLPILRMVHETKPLRIQMSRILPVFLWAAVALTGCGTPPAKATRLAAEPSAAASFTKPISFAILEDYDKGDSLSEVVKDFMLFKELGVPVW